jgi:pimeloyl-ACP methyl ester carboxylesterase
MAPPLVLLHPFLVSGLVWQDVVPLLADHHEVFTPTLLGHSGGPQVQRRPATIWDVIDATEAYLDEHGLQRPHLAGNSMGGFVAIELARRGRAATVCAFSPAGFWSTDGKPPARGPADRKVHKLAAVCRLAARSGPLGPLLFKPALARRLSLRFLNSARHGDRVPADKLAEMTHIVAACSVDRDVLSTDQEHVAPLDPLPCPITLAWSQKDSIFPVATYGRLARERLPGAAFEILPDVDHVPMLDDPGLVARTILTACRGKVT